MKDWTVYAHHVLDACAKLRRIRERGDPAMDDILYDAVLRNLQTLLESTARLPEDAKSRHDAIPVCRYEDGVLHFGGGLLPHLNFM